MSQPVLLASTTIGDVTLCDGIVYVLTTCCKASGKGSERGVVCRACYQQVPDLHGWAALATDTEAGAEALAEMLRPSLEHYADEAAARVMATAAARQRESD